MISTKPRGEPTPDDPTAVVLRSHDIHPPQDQMVDHLDYRDSDEVIRDTSWVCTKGTVSGLKFSPCHADENIWETSTQLHNCGDRDRADVCSTHNEDGSVNKFCWPGCHSSSQAGHTLWCEGQTCGRIRYEDPMICPKFGKGVGATIALPLKPGVPAPLQGLGVVCKYDINALAGDCEAATKWTMERRKDLAEGQGTPVDTNWFHFDLMEKLCGRNAPGGEGCPSTSKSYVDKDGNPICSNLNACGLCRDWATRNTQGIQESSRMIREYCGAQKFDPKEFDNPKFTDPSCRCFHIRDRPGLPALSGPVGCWYSKCVDNGLVNNLVPPADRLDMAQVAKCPDICAEVVNIIDADVVDIGDITMTCGDSGGGGGGGGWGRWGDLTARQKAAIEIGGLSVLIGLGGLLIYNGSKK